MDTNVIDTKYIISKPSGRFGNAFFRYMACSIINIFNPSMKYILYDDYINKGETTPTIINDENFLNYTKKLENFDVVMNGYFQFGYIYLKNKIKILEYMKQNCNEHYIQTDLKERFLMKDLLNDLSLKKEQMYDIVIHVRLNDFKGRPEFIEINYYNSLFETIDFNEKTVCLICDHNYYHDINDKIFISQLVYYFNNKNIKINIETNSLMIDFNIMKQAKILICSMSTLAWTAAYLSNHIQTCYMPNYHFYNVDERRFFNFRKPIKNTILYDVKTTSPILKQIKPYILTLKQFPERLEELTDFNQNLTKIGLEPDIYNGINGKNIVVMNTQKENIKNIIYDHDNDDNDDNEYNCVYSYDMTIRTNNKVMTKGEFGCAWSHLNLLKKLINEPKNSNVKYYLVLEDDVTLVKPLDELHDLLQHIPEDADLCHLAVSNWNPFKRKNKVNKYFYDCKIEYFNKTTAYLISKKGAKQILNYYPNSINIPIDDLFNTIFCINPYFKFYVPYEHFFKEHENNISLIHSM